jgi:hypothetical protein
MDMLLVFGSGLVAGAVLAWVVIEISGQFKRSRELEAAAAKARKEISEKSKKAREDKRKARSTAARSVLFSILLGAVALFLLWLATMVVLSG